MGIGNFFTEIVEQERKPADNERLIFLSFDGVVHRLPEDGVPSSWDSGVLPLLGIRFFLAKPMQQILRVCETLNAKIILTTSWKSQGFNISEFNQVFKGLIIGQTSDKSSSGGEVGRREREIMAYLDEFCNDSPYAIIDANPNNFSSNDINLYLTDPAKCFTDNMADDVINSFEHQ